MNKQAILHLQDSQYCYPISAKNVEVRLRVDKDDKFDSVAIIYGNKYDYHRVQLKAELNLRYTDANFAYYIASITLSDVRFVYIFELTADGKKYYFSEDGLSESYDFTLAYYNSFQLPYVNAIDVQNSVQWMKNAVFYEIFVDRFCIGDKTKDLSYVNLPWGSVPKADSYAGGDLQGIIDKLDYIKDLGVNALYLTPIFASISNHKYDIYDYYNVDKSFGDNQVLGELVQQAHKRGIKIVLDGVFNHCSDRLDIFQDALKRGKDSPYYDWFLINGDKIDKSKVNYETFSSCCYMPKFNTSNKQVRRYLIDIAKYWIKKYDIDGWRLDVADEVSHDFWRHFREEIKELKSEAVILGENWHDSYPYLKGDQFDGIMNYAVTKATVDFFVKSDFCAKNYADKLSEIYLRNTSVVNSMMLNLLDSHDTYRFFTLVERDKDKLIAALAIIYMNIGAAFIYYGTENCAEGGYDPDCRRTMDWTSKNNEVIKLLSALAKLRNKDEIISGEVFYKSSGKLFVLERVKNSTIRLTVNNRKQKVAYSVQGKVLLSHNYDGNSFSGIGFVIEELS